MLAWLRNLDNETTSHDINQYISIILIYDRIFKDSSRFKDLSNSRLLDYIGGETNGTSKKS